MTDYNNTSKLGNLLNQAGMLDAQVNGKETGPGLGGTVNYLNSGNLRVEHQKIPDYVHDID